MRPLDAGDIVRLCATPTTAPTRTLATLLLAFPDLDTLEAALNEAVQRAEGDARDRVWSVRDALSHRRPSCAAALAALRSAEQELTGATAGNADERLAACRRAFDAAVRASPEASVALYSLGDASVLDAATAEVVAQFAEWGLLGPTRVALQIGCGTGRFEAALAPHVAAAHGVDISPGMVAAARARCAALPNVQIHLGSGQDLAPFATEGFDLVYAVDSVPYLVQCGDQVVRRHFVDAARLLRPGGHVVVLNYSYRGDPQRDDDDVHQLAAEVGLTVKIAGATPFRLWDGRGYLLRREAKPKKSP